MKNSQRFVFSSGTSNKFWEIQLNDKSLVTVWGRLGTEGQSKSKTFESNELAKKEYEKLVSQKTAKGYVKAKSKSKSKSTTSRPGESATASKSKSSVRSITRSQAKPTNISSNKEPSSANYNANQFDDSIKKLAAEASKTNFSIKNSAHGKFLLSRSPEASLVILRAVFRLGRKIKWSRLEDLRNSLLRRTLSYNTQDIETISRYIGSAYIDPVYLGAIERWVASDPSNLLSEITKKNLLKIVGSKDAKNSFEDQTPKLVRIYELLGHSTELNPLDSNAPWAKCIIDEIEGMGAKQKEKWLELVLHCASATYTPSDQWFERNEVLIREIGNENFLARFQNWALAVSKLQDGNQANIVEGLNEMVLIGLVWCNCYEPQAQTCAILASLAVAMYKRLPSSDARSARVGNACIAALARMNTHQSVGQLIVVKSKVKDGGLQRMIAKHLASTAESKSISIEELEELSLPNYGLTEVGSRVESFENLKAKVIATDVNTVKLYWFERNKPVDHVPKAANKLAQDWINEIQQDVKDLERMLQAQRNKIEETYCSSKSWNFKQWRERYLDDPVRGIIVRTLIWNFTEKKKRQTAIYYGGVFVDAFGKPIKISDQSDVSLWHPLDSKAKEIMAWRAWIVENQIQQGIKQAFREVYLLTDAEKKTKLYSNRFAGHILRQSQYRALAQLRNWKASFLGAFDAGQAGEAYREFPEHNLIAKFRVDPIHSSKGEGYGYAYITTDRVTFHSKVGKKTIPVPIAEVSEMILSETLRDVDLFVSVCSVGNDPNWKDRGRTKHFDNYWSSYSTADLAESGKSRRSALELLLPRLKQLNGRYKLLDKYLQIEGNLHTYRIHLGCGSIFIEPSSQYLCIVPKGLEDSSFFLPFDADRTLSIILSKAILLMADDKIADRQIVSQLRSANR